MFGQYSSQFVGRKTKRDMVAGAARRHPDSTILDARKVANNTLAYRVPESGTSFIALHDTDVLAWGDHGVVAVDIAEETMIDWVRSRYVFRNFAFLAFRFSGLTEQGAHLWLHDIDRNGGKLDARALGKVRRFARRHMSLA